MPQNVKNDDLGPEKGTKSIKNDELFPVKGMESWNEEPQELPEHDNADLLSKVAYSSEDEDKQSIDKHEIIKEFTTTELMNELHARFDHIILLAKRNLADKSIDKKNFSMAITSMFIGDAHALLGMNIELTDHLKCLLTERRGYISECSEADMLEDDE
jgi:hypothetical protein